MKTPSWLYIAKSWRHPKVIIGFFVLEFFLTIACLLFYALAEPDTYRYKLWQNGADYNFNSAPSVVKYAAANYRPIKEPIVWSDTLVNFDIAISVVSMFFLLVKVVMFVMKLLLPIVSILLHLPLLALYAVSLSWQTTPDRADPDRPQIGLPWYISKGCGYATEGNYGYCLQARTVFALTCVMIAFFSVYEIMSIWSAIPSREEKLRIDENRQDKKEWDVEMKQYKHYAGPEEDRAKREAARGFMPKTPMSATFSLRNPMTPRTTAFTQLNGGEPTPSKASGPLPFRQQWGDSVTPQNG